MDELRDLYQTVILDHNKAPRNFGALENPQYRADGNNPLCGDKLTLYIESDGERITDIRFEGAGCAISTASASLMTEFVKGRSFDEVRETFERFHDLLTSNSNEDRDAAELGKLAVFSGVRAYPVRVKCATLAWHTLQAALSSREEAATTE